MGKLGWLMVVVLGGQSAYAVRVADCPASIKIESSGLRLNRSLQKILGEAAYSGNPADLEPEETQAITESINNIATTRSVVRVLPLFKAKSGRCRYESGARGDMEEVELYTKAGKDTVLVQTKIGPRGILLRLYGKIESLSKTEIKLSPGASMALAIPRYPYTSYEAGGPLVFVGKVANLAAHAGR